MLAVKKSTPKKTRTAQKTIKKSVVKSGSMKLKKGLKKNLANTAVVPKTSKSTISKKASSLAANRSINPARTRATKSLSTTKKAAKPDQDVVHFPSNAPVRSIEKAALIRSELSHYWQKSMYRIAIVSGLCFVLIGSTLASVSVFNTDSGINNSALVGSAVTEPLDTVLTLQSPVPDILSEQVRVSFSLTNVYPESVEYYLQNEATQSVSQSIKVNNFADVKYVFTLSPENISAGPYKLYIQYTQKNQTEPAILLKRTESVARFTIPEEEMTDNEPRSLTDNEGLLGDPSASTTQKDRATNDVMPLETDQEAVEEIIEKIVLDELSKEIVKPPTTEPALIKTPETELDSLPRVIIKEEPSIKPVVEIFSLNTKESTVSGLFILNVQATDFSSLELYARPVTSVKSRFLARASERSGKKMFIVNTETFLPNGTYEFYAVGTDAAEKTQTTPSVQITVKNVTTPPSITTEAPKEPVSAEESVEVSQTPQSVSSNEPASPARVFAPINLADQRPDEAQTTDVKEASKRLFEQKSVKITQLLNAYASARQSGDEILIRAALEALISVRVELANAALIDRQLGSISDDVILDMSQKLADLQNKVNVFEQIRSEKSGGKSALDTDNDGIPDFDEVNLYRTNPSEPDTDGDGFTDGIEIIRGFDPLNDVAEAVIVFESPKESVAFIQADVLRVEEVTPVINSIAGTNDTSVRAEIRGRGLPNSFVTLYIFSSPTIVTIKTDADGSFVYTLDKELEDGSHDVFVALTDNTGSIVARSNPFSFIKEAQAFTPVDATGGDIVGINTAVQSAPLNSYNGVIGVGVLAFGLILVMLGLSLRTREDELAVPTSNGSKTGFTSNAKESSSPEITS